MRFALHTSYAMLALCLAANGQGPSGAKAEFDAASIKAAVPQTGQFPRPSSSQGGPGTANPGLFRCTNCTLAFLISKAYELERYQFPGQAQLPDGRFDISARVPEGATTEQFAAMLQSLLKDRFNLAWHYETRQVQGYELVIAKNGPKLKDSGPPKAPEADAGHSSGAGGDWHSFGGGGGHELTRPGLIVFGGQAKYRGDYQTTGELARMIAGQLAKPVDDHTGLTGRYDVSLSWTDDGSHAASHAAGPAIGEHGDHGGGPASATDVSGPSLIGAVQAQLGLRLEPKKATGKIFVADHIDKTPTAN